MSELTSKIAIGMAQFGMSYGIANINGQVSAVLEGPAKKIFKNKL